MNNIFLCLGSNLGHREENIRHALIELEEARVRMVKASSLYETEPVLYAEQDSFVNLVLSCKTNISPRQLLLTIKKIEKKLGRTKTFRYGPRIIDIDILFYDDKIIELQNLSIPHRGIADRKFVLVPLNEIAPTFIHPLLNMTITELLAECKDQSSVLKLSAHEKIS